MNLPTETTQNSSETNNMENASVEVHITTAPETATLTEKQLWAIFVDMSFQTTCAMGPIDGSCCPYDLVTDPGEYGYIDDFTAEMSDLIADADDPEDHIDNLIQDLSDYISGLRKVGELFARTKETFAVYPDEDSEDDEVRYRVPAIQQEAAA